METESGGRKKGIISRNIGTLSSKRGEISASDDTLYAYINDLIAAAPFELTNKRIKLYFYMFKG